MTIVAITANPQTTEKLRMSVGFLRAKWQQRLQSLSIKNAADVVEDMSYLKRKLKSWDTGTTFQSSKHTLNKVQAFLPSGVISVAVNICMVEATDIVLRIA